MIRLAPYIGAAAVAAYLSWSATDYHHQTEIAQLNKEHQEQILIIVKANADEITRAYNKNEKLKGQIKQLDEKYIEELALEQDKTDALRAAVSDSDKRLRVAIKRTPTNTNCAGVPDASGSGVGANQGAELDEQAEQAYFSLREGIANTEIKLETCQSILNAIIERYGEEALVETPE